MFQMDQVPPASGIDREPLYTEEMPGRRAGNHEQKANQNWGAIRKRRAERSENGPGKFNEHADLENGLERGCRDIGIEVFRRREAGKVPLHCVVAHINKQGAHNINTKDRKDSPHAAVEEQPNECCFCHHTGKQECVVPIHCDNPGRTRRRFETRLAAIFPSIRENRP